MTILYDNGEVEIYVVSGGIVVEISGQAEVTLSASQARAIAAALIQAAEEILPG